MADDTADGNEIDSAEPSCEMRAVIELFFYIEAPRRNVVGAAGD